VSSSSGEGWEVYILEGGGGGCLLIIVSSDPEIMSDPSALKSTALTQPWCCIGRSRVRAAAQMAVQMEMAVLAGRDAFWEARSNVRGCFRNVLMCRNGGPTHLLMHEELELKFRHA
jgi:hypothetical protein